MFFSTEDEIDKEVRELNGEPTPKNRIPTARVSSEPERGAEITEPKRGAGKGSFMNLLGALREHSDPRTPDPTNP